MTRVLPLLNGRPEQLRALANALMGSASRLSAVNTVLLGLRAGAHWQSDSGRLFESAVQAPPPIIAAVIERYAGAARAIRTLAGELEQAQEDITGAISSHREAWRRHDVFMDRRGFATDPAEQAHLVQAMNAEIAVIDAAERRHTAAAHRHLEADRRCAQQLQTLADDVLDDPTGYTWLANSGKVSRPVAVIGGFLPGPWKLIGVAGVGAGIVSNVGLLVFYDEGSWKQIGANALSSAVTTAGSVLVAGSLVGGKVVLEGGKRVFTKTANPSTGFRLGAGVQKAKDDWIVANKLKLGLPVPARLPQVPDRPKFTAPNRSKMQKGQHFVGKKIDDAFINNWELAMANGKGAQVMFVAGVTTQKAPTIVKQINSVEDRFAPEPEQKSEQNGLIQR